LPGFPRRQLHLPLAVAEHEVGYLAVVGYGDRAEGEHGQVDDGEQPGLQPFLELQPEEEVQVEGEDRGVEEEVGLE
jgi:hypothetical protein